MSGDHDVCSKCGAGIFACNCDAPTNEPDYVTHNVACCISPEELARRIREAKIEGVKDAVCELEVWDDSCPDSMRAACQEDAEENEVCVACWLDAIESGDWPPKE